jgi:hypothetical protein
MLATTHRDLLNASTMLGQSKTAHQAEIDSACELIDFWRYNRGSRSGSMRSSRSPSPARGTGWSTGRSTGSCSR